jgi:phage protein D
MSLGPFYKVVVEDSGLDISSVITTFGYSRDVDKDNILDLGFEFEDVSKVDADYITEGTILIFKYGILGQGISKKRRVKIKTVIPSFSNRITVKVTCHDAGTNIKRTSSKKIYKNKTSSEIAEIIADEAKLEKNIDKTTKVWKDMPQGNRSEFELLGYLADREKGGKFIFYVDDDTLNFVERDLSKNSISTYYYKDGNSGILSFKPAFKEAEAGAAAAGVTVSDEEVSVNNANSVESSLGDTRLSVDADGVKLGVTGSGSTNIVKKGKELVTPVEDKEEAENLAQKTKNEATLKSITGTLTMEMDALLELDEIITIKGVGAKFSGNYYVASIKDKVGGTAISTVGLNKNSTKKSLRKDSDENEEDSVNKVVGPDETKKELTLVNFDANGNEISRT